MSTIEKDLAWLEALPRGVGHTHALATSGATVVIAAQAQARTVDAPTVTLQAARDGILSGQRKPVCLDLFAVMTMLSQAKAVADDYQAKLCSVAKHAGELEAMKDVMQGKLKRSEERKRLLRCELKKAQDALLLERGLVTARRARELVEHVKQREARRGGFRWWLLPCNPDGTIRQPWGKFAWFRLAEEIEGPRIPLVHTGRIYDSQCEANAAWDGGGVSI